MRTVLHVGDMDVSCKRTGSYEGAGLSVCLHPSAWRRIARGWVGGTTHRLTNPDGLFVDAHAIDDTTRTGILEWAVARGLAAPTPIWTVSWDDCDEDGEERRSCFTFDDRDEAEAEADAREDEDARIVRTEGHRSTPALDALAMQDRPSLGDASVIDVVLPIWAHEAHGIDGVWWADEHAVHRLSAPRGVIRAQALGCWNVQAIGHDPDHECDGSDEDDGCDEDEA